MEPCRSSHFEAQFYKRESGKALSLGVFAFDAARPESKEAAATKAAHAADRATVKYYESLGQPREYIATRLNVRFL